MKSRIFFFLLLVLSACAKNQSDKNISVKEKTQLAKAIKITDSIPDSSSKVLSEATISEKQRPSFSKPTSSIPPSKTSNIIFPWLNNYDPQQSLENQIHLPEGYQRIKVKNHSFGAWIRQLPLKSASMPVYLYNGELKGNQSAHHRVLDIDIGQRDLQQCADAVMRLKAEYHYSQKEFDKIHFNYTSGDRVSFDDWRKGRKPQVKGNKV